MTDSGRAGTPQNPRRAAAHQSPAPALEVVLRHRRCGTARGAVVTRGMAPRPEGVDCFAGAQVSSWHRPTIRAPAVAASGIGGSPDAPEAPQDPIAATADPKPPYRFGSVAEYLGGTSAPTVLRFRGATFEIGPKLRRRTHASRESQLPIL
jgi:hypothetical protein